MSRRNARFVTQTLLGFARYPLVNIAGDTSVCSELRHSDCCPADTAASKVLQ